MSDQDKDKKGFSFFDESKESKGKSPSDESSSKELGDEDFNKLSGGAQGPVCPKCNRPPSDCQCIDYA